MVWIGNGGTVMVEQQWWNSDFGTVMVEQQLWKRNG